MNKICMIKYTDKKFYKFIRLNKFAKISVNRKMKFLKEVKVVLNFESGVGFWQLEKQGMFNTMENTEQDIFRGQ